MSLHTILTRGGLALVALGSIVLGGTAAAYATPAAPYSVSAEGVTLNAGTFPAHGHVNWRTTERSGGVHFDPNNGQPGGAYIGQAFLPVPLEPGECIVWVQYSETNYHYGEGGEPPVCRPMSTPTPSPSPSITSTPEPTPSVTPEPSPTATVTPSATLTPSPTASATVAPAPGASPTPGTGTPARDLPPALAATGADDAVAIAALAISLVSLGLAVMSWGRPRKTKTKTEEAPRGR